MARAATALSGDHQTDWDANLQERAWANVERMERNGLRVMAAAHRDLDPSTFDPASDLLAYVGELEMTSLVGMVDPPRDESRGAVREAEQAHIRVRMVTGDDVITGAAIAQQLGISGEAILGSDFAALDESDRLSRIDNIGVIGRVAPEHKVMIIETLKKKGHVVAMTGDGINDAPAIKAADIGIAMGSGTEVAKNASRMILSDDNFATIVYAVEQGRKIWDNLTKYIRFVLITLVAFVLTFLGASLFNLAGGEPFSAGQALWIHFIVNAGFGFALGFDQETPGLMRLTPRPRGQSILTNGLMLTVGLVGLYTSARLLGLIAFGKSHYGSVKVGSSIAFTAFALVLIISAFECRSERDTALTVDTFASRQMNKLALIELVLVILTTRMDGPPPPAGDDAAHAHSDGASVPSRSWPSRALGARQATRSTSRRVGQDPELTKQGEVDFRRERRSDGADNSKRKGQASRGGPPTRVVPVRRDNALDRGGL
jgi:Ca2+-transporting ATPase